MTQKTLIGTQVLDQKADEIQNVKHPLQPIRL